MTPLQNPHVLAPLEALERLGSGERGLTGEEAARRLAEVGPNELRAAPRTSPWKILLGQLKNTLIVILLIATLLSVALGHGLESLVIAVIVLFAVLLGFVQEYRAERSLDALRRMAAPAATTLRDGLEGRVPARELVPGDVIVLRAGDRVPADARVLESANLKLEEAALTGESLPVDKRSEALPDPALPVGDRENMVFAGTLVSYGRGRAVVTATGMGTEFGRIAGLLEQVETTRTPLQKNLDRVGSTLARFSLVIVAVIVVLGLVRGQPFVEMFIFGVALAVAVVPEALPAVVTISLAIGVQKMVRRHALVRSLPAVETLGSTTVVCSDKTGTLTRDEMTARRVVVHGLRVDLTGTGYAPHGAFLVGQAPVEPRGPLYALLEAGVLASDAELRRAEGEGRRWEVVGDPTEGALIVAAEKAGISRATLTATHPRRDEIPFTAETRRMSTLHDTPDGLVIYVKGAPEVVLDACACVLTEGGIAPLDAAERARLLAEAAAMADDALRVLALARKHDADLQSADRGLTLLGLVGMIDPPREEALDAIRRCGEAGIRAVMITGDHPATARAVARELGLLVHGRVVTGPELEGWDEARLDAEIGAIDVFARVSPAHKLRVVSALQRRGEVVAMTGDGVNDAPALRKADIGVAMGITGTDVSREAAAMTLTDDSFASIVAAVEEGRLVFGNIKKYLMYLLSSNIGEIGLMLGTALLSMPLPLSAVQLLYVNLVTDGLPALALAVDPPDRDLMQRPPRDARTGIFTRPVVALMMLGGAWSALMNVSLFAWALRSGRPLEEAMTMTFVSLVLLQFYKAYAYRSDRESSLVRPFANRWLNLSIVAELGLLVATLYVPWLSQLFGAYALTLADWGVVLGVSATILPVLELGKLLARRGALGPLD